MNDIKEILVFISFSFKRFFINLASWLGYLFIVVTLTTAVFFIGYKSFKSHYFFYGYLVVLVLVTLKLRSFLFYRHQLPLNVHYVRFLADRDAYIREGAAAGVPPGLRQIAGELRKTIKKKGIRFMSKKIVAALTALQAEGNEEFSPENMGKLRYTAVTLFMLRLAILLMMWLPFALLSFLFTSQSSASVQFLIYLLGLFFVWFLDAAFLDPIIALLVQKRVKLYSFTYE
jgi:hypothetical protein